MVPLFIGQCSEERAELEGVVNGPVATSDSTKIEHFEITFFVYTSGKERMGLPLLHANRWPPVGSFMPILFSYPCEQFF
jgi:hypothetical protein